MLKIAVAVGRSAEAKQWKNRSFLWSDFVGKLRTPQVTHEGYDEYLAMSKTEQGKIKDVGGYVCGYLNGGRRGKVNVMYRSALTLDLDFAPYDFWGLFTMFWDCAAVLHSTHKHSVETPRYRLVVPLDREVTPDEYVAIARKFAASVNIEYFDPTTFDTNRLMFWPSVAKDGEYLFEEQDGAPLCADKVLGSYRNWKDISEWRFSKKVAERVREDRAKKQADPLTKNNIVGYFCNAYDIHTAIDEFLPDIYESVGGDRYTFLQGSTASGLVTYDDVFAYSHHGTDPASGELCNAFDLVRIHKFGGADVEGNISKSYKLMTEFCRSLGPVKKEIAQNIIRDFDEYKTVKSDREKEPSPATKQKTDTVDTPEEWREQLDVDKFNKYEASERNFSLILRNDPRLKGTLVFNEFASKKIITRPLPGCDDAQKYPRRMCDADYSAIRSYIGHVYGISSKLKLDDEIALELQRNRCDPVKEWFDSLEWDGTARIDRLLIDCFNTTDNAYTREVSRKWLVAAVARVMEPGCKYDTIISLVGEEGTRKSSFFRKLGRDWFSDSFTTVEGNKAYEQVLGRLVIEIAELSAFDKAESAMIKHFVTKQSDTYRPAYGHEDVEFARRCVFAATSNNNTFLRAGEGNRRFWPVDVRLPKSTGGKLDPMSKEFDALIPQIWAEAVAMWRLGEPLILSPEAERIADAERAGHVEVDDRRGMVEQYLDMEVPEGWRDMDIEVRKDYTAAPEAYKGKRTGTPYKRRRICIAEIWCECFGKKREDLNQRMSRELTAIMRTVPGWEYVGKLQKVKHYGPQRCYEYTG